MTIKLAPRNAKDAAAFLRRQHETKSRSWRSLCLSLQRQARGLPAVYPSAASAAAATPPSERIHRIADLRRGMVAYSDHPTDANRFGHVYFIAGWKNPKDRSDPNTLLTWTNLADGRVGLVPITFYLRNWGDPFQFGATWLNGYDFADFNSPPVPVVQARLGARYEHAMEDLRGVIRYHETKGNLRLVELLKRDLDVMEKRFKTFGG